MNLSRHTDPGGGNARTVFEQQRGAALDYLEPEDRCSDCGAWHGIAPLVHLMAGVRCGHDRNRPCSKCGQPVGDLGVSGPDICGACDAAAATIETRRVEPCSVDEVAEMKAELAHTSIDDLLKLAPTRDDYKTMLRRIFAEAELQRRGVVLNRDRINDRDQHRITRIGGRQAATEKGTGGVPAIETEPPSETSSEQTVDHSARIF